MTISKSVLMSLTVLGGAVMSQATVLNPLTPAQGFNAFVQGNVTLNQGDTHAGVAVGGNLTFGSGFSVANNNKGTYVAPGDSQVSSLVVDGKVNFSGSSGEMRVLSGGYVKVGDTTGTYVHTKDNNGANMNTVINDKSNGMGNPRIALNTQQSATSVTAASGIDFGSAFALMSQYSTEMSQLTPTLTLTTLPNDGKVSYAPLANALNVINLSGTTLNAISEFNLVSKPTGTSPLIFNIDVGNAANFTFNGLKLPGLAESDASFILYNFYNAYGTITFANAKDSVLGTIYAPEADFVKTASQNIVGQLIAETYYHGSGELHYQPFTGFIPETPVPEASSVAFGALLTGGLALHAWRRRSASARA